jgi:3(or 17)beta-hydroxysteroid dehydrogenase
MTAELGRRVALVTGGASGFGRQSAIRLAEQGAFVCVSDINAEGGRETVSMLGGRGLFCSHDVTRADDWRAVIGTVIKRFGRLDVLVNSAGVDHAEDNVSNIDAEIWSYVFGINLKGTYLGCQYVIPEMRRAGGGAIINLGSILGVRGDGSALAYCASKGGVRALTKSVAAHCAQEGYCITCNAICPGYMLTSMVRSSLAKAADPLAAQRRLESFHPMGRLGDADDVAQLVVFLASERAQFITGAELLVDGGYLAV